MKKICLFVLFVLTINFYSCNDKENYVSLETENVILIQNDKLKAERIHEKSKEIEFFKTDLSFLQLKSSNQIEIDFVENTKLTFQSTEIIFYMFKIKNNDNLNLIAFKKGDSIFYAISLYSTFNDITNYSLRKLNNEEYFTISVNNENKILSTLENPEISFQNDITSKLGLGMRLKSVQPTCDDLTSNYFDCIGCALTELMGDLGWAVLCSLNPPACMTAASIHCL